MRTTLVIPDPVFRRAKQAAKDRNMSLSKLVTEAIDLHLNRRETAVREPTAPYRIAPAHMGAARVDINNRDALYRAMEDDA